MTTIQDVFSSARAKSKKVFIAFITAGDPRLSQTEQFVVDLVESGADIIELGIPYSDPIADGPTNIKAAERALRHHVTLKNVMDLVSKLRKKKIDVPIILFTYLNPVFHMGYEKFASAAAKAGVTGTLIVDLPPEEASDFKSIMDQNKLETVFLASPTTTNERLQRLDSCSSGFVYYVSRTGVTGIQKSVSTSLESEITNLRKYISSPIAVGFGISSGLHAKQAGKNADGIIVGSALVKIIEESKGNLGKARRGLRKLASEIRRALDRK